MTVILVTFNSAHIVARSLVSLPGPETAQIVVVDNASDDDSIQVVRGTRPDAQVIVNVENVGFARAVNTGVDEATGEYVLLLNPDAVIDADAVGRLVETMRADPSIGIASPLLAGSDGRSTLLGAGHSPSIRHMALHASGLSRLSDRLPILEGHHLFTPCVTGRQREIDWVSGGCLLIPRRLWVRMGGLSTRWFMYGEDVDLCLRTRRAGYKVVVDGRIVAVHDVGESVRGVAGKVNTVWIENLYDLYCTSVATNAIQCWVWKQVVCSGFRARAIVFRIFGAVLPARRTTLLWRADRMRCFAGALGVARSTYESVPAR